MAEFKQISNVDVINELTESDNVLVVGSDGALKQTSSGNLGMDITKTEVVEAPAEEDNLVLVSNGTVKQVPVSNFGSKGYIAVLTEDDLNNPAVDYADGPVISANYDELYEVLCAGGNAWIDMTAMIGGRSTKDSAGVSPTAHGAILTSIQLWQITDIGLLVVIMGGDMSILFPNGSHNLPSAVLPS
jgi:hypothetical protein